MSTLTKILIVLLTLSSIFLCGIVVTYVGSAENYKERYDSQSTEIRNLRNQKSALEDDLNNAKDDSARIQADLNQEISGLKVEIARLTESLATAVRDKDNANRSLADLAGRLETLEQTYGFHADRMERAEAENVELLSLKAQNETDIEDLSIEIQQNMAIISQLNDQIRSLEEQKAELLSSSNRQLQSIGRQMVPPVPVTPQVSQAEVAAATAPIGLNGLVKTVDMEKNMVEIDLGSTDGVKKNMNFHVTRGDSFICDIVIFEVDSERAVGIPELVKEPPRAGDIAQTNL